MEKMAERYFDNDNKKKHSVNIYSWWSRNTKILKIYKMKITSKKIVKWVINFLKLKFIFHLIYTLNL